MPNQLSRADLALVEALAAEDISITADRLVGWRKRGLLPKTSPRRLRGGGSEVGEHPPVVLHMAACIASAVGRGGSWQNGGLALFEEDLPLSEPVMRECLLWFLERGVAAAARVWAEAAVSLPPMAGTLTPDRLGDVAALAAELARKNRATRTFRQTVEAEFRRFGRFGSGPEELRHAVNEAVGLRLAVLAGAGPLPPDLDDIARYGRGNPPPGIPVVLAHELLACSRTLTIREAYAAARINTIAMKRDPALAHLKDMWLLHVSAIDVAIARLGEPPYLPDRPLTSTAIRGWERRADELEAEERERQYEIPGQGVLGLVLDSTPVSSKSDSTGFM